MNAHWWDICITTYICLGVRIRALLVFDRWACESLGQSDEWRYRLSRLFLLYGATLLLTLPNPKSLIGKDHLTPIPMRRILLLLFSLAWLNTTVNAGEATTDHLTVSDLQTDGEYTFFTVSLEGSRHYSAYNMDIHFPNGLFVYQEDDAYWVMMAEDDGMYPFKKVGNKKNYSHSFSCMPNADGKSIRISCFSSESESFKENSGVLFYVYVKVSPFMKAGKNTLTIDGIALTMADETQYDPVAETHTLIGPSTSSLTLNISATNQWSTCVLPFDAALPTGVMAYTCGSTTGDYVVLTEATSFEAYTPYVLYAENGFTGELSGTVDPDKYEATPTVGLLNGAVVAQEITSGYVLQKQAEGVKFYNVNGLSFTIPEGRCWLSAGNSARSFGFIDEATSIDDVRKLLNTNDVYDLQGHRVAVPLPGHIYIIGGEKVLKLR